MAMAVFGIGIMFGPIVGPFLGGWITDNWSWNWIFYINIPIGIISILMVLLVIKDPHYMKRTTMKIDYWGIALLVIGLGSLQIVLDKGQRENWFSSGFIFWMSITAGTALLLFVIVELFSEHPVVDLRIFKNRSFSTGNVVMFFTFFSLFASIVLLPIFLQSLMGYTATLAGLVLGPGGVATLIAMPMAGRLVTKVNPKGLLALGLLICSYSTYLMSKFTLYADFNTLVWPRIVLGVGMGFLFIPLTTLTLSTVKKEAMGNATSIYNLLRNLGGSFGVAFVTTMTERREQFHQFRLIEHLSPFDRAYQLALNNSSQILQYKGAGPLSQQTGLGVIYRELLRQASMLSFNDAFHSVSIILCCVIPLVLLIRRGRTDAPAAMH